MSGGQQLQQPDSVEGINMGTDRAFPSQAWQDKEKSIPPPVPEPEYPSRLGLGLIALGLCLAVFLFALDQTIVANAIPTITDEFGSVSDIGWYGSGKFHSPPPWAYSLFTLPRYHLSLNAPHIITLNK